MKTDIERFLQKVSVAESGCWSWLSAKRKRGYGVFSVSGYQHYAHRFSYEQFRGPIPAGLQIDHLCRNPSCVNPTHLEVVTPHENTARGNGISALNMRKTACKVGHRFTKDNTYYTRDQRRQCRACHREYDRQRVPRHRSATAELPR